MAASALFSQIAGYDEQNDCLHLVLGLASVTRQYLEMVARETAEPLPEIDPPAEGETDAMIDLHLGLIAFSLRTSRLLELFATSPPPATDRLNPAVQTAIREILR